MFGQFTKYQDVTRLDNGFGTGARLTGYFLKRLALEYEGDYSATQSARVGDLGLNHRVDMMLYLPVVSRLNFFGGGGWTGTQYTTDTTKNQYDSGGNAVAGFKYCIGAGWTWRADMNVDFKDPSDQTVAGDRTRTWNMRFGFGRLIGNGSNSPCYQVPPPPPRPAPMAAPERQPEPAPAPQPPPRREPEPVQQAPTPAPPAPAPTPAPPPKPRELMSLRNAYFALSKYELTAHGKDTLSVVVQYMQAHPEARIQSSGPHRQHRHLRRITRRCRSAGPMPLNRSSSRAGRCRQPHFGARIGEEPADGRQQDRRRPRQEPPGGRARNAQA